MQCTCGHPEHYNSAIDNGLCNICIEERLELLELLEKMYPNQVKMAKDAIETVREFKCICVSYHERTCEHSEQCPLYISEVKDE